MAAAWFMWPDLGVIRTVRPNMAPQIHIPTIFCWTPAEEGRR